MTTPPWDQDSDEEKAELADTLDREVDALIAEIRTADDEWDDDPREWAGNI